MNSDLTYLASKCFNLTSKNWSKSCTCRSVRLSVQYLMQSHNWIDFGLFFHFFCKFLTRHIKKEWQNVKVFWPPQLKNLKFAMLWPHFQRSISNCVLAQIKQNPLDTNSSHYFIKNVKGGADRKTDCYPSKQTNTELVYIIRVCKLDQGESCVISHKSVWLFLLYQGHQKPVNDTRDMSGIPHSCLGCVSQVYSLWPVKLMLSKAKF